MHSTGGLHGAGRLRRGVTEFLTLPLVIAAAFCAAAVTVAAVDMQGAAPAARRLVEAFISPSSSAGFIDSVATSLMTVTSITFSVLLVAVQQTATSLSAVVFDQYLRRRSNQVYFGYFVGATAFSYIVDAFARARPAPVYGAVAALVLTVGSLVALLMLIHSTVDQMRPQSVVRSIHELALRARESELALLDRTRPARRTTPGTDEREVRAMDSGYVVGLDAPALADVARSIGRRAEVLVDGRLGEYLVYGETVARVTGVAADDDGVDGAVLNAFRFDDIRRVEVDAGYSIDQLENIAWMTGTSASQSPYTATTAIRALRDLLGRWLMVGERDRDDPPEEPDLLPVVYQDGASRRVLEAFGTLLVGAAESRQAHTAAMIIGSFAHVVPRLRSEIDHTAFTRSLDAALPSVIEQAELPTLSDALDELVGALEAADLDTDRVRQVQVLLRRGTERLLPEPSDDPDAAHPSG